MNGRRSLSALSIKTTRAVMNLHENAKRHASDFPAFHEAAQYVILRAVSSAACERVFSVAKHVYESCGAAMSESVFNGRVRAKYNKNKVPDFGEYETPL